MIAYLIHNRHVPLIIGLLAIVPTGLVLAGIASVFLEDLGREMQAAYNSDMYENRMQYIEDRPYRLWMEFRGFWVELMPHRSENRHSFMTAGITIYSMIEVLILIVLTFFGRALPSKTIKPAEQTDTR